MSQGRNQPTDYTIRYQIRAGRVTFADYVQRRQAIQEGRLLGLNLYLPDNDASVVPFIKEATQFTTPTEVATYLGNVTGMSDSVDPPSALSGPSGPSTVPDSPTSVSASGGNGQATVSFTAPTNTGGSPILSYTVTSSPDGVSVTGSSSPLLVTGLTNGTPYTFTVVATNSIGNSIDSAASSPVTPNANTPLAPVLTAITFKTTTSVTLTFTQASNSTPAITNYKYSLNGGAYTAFSPVDTTSPVTINGLSPNTSYTITLKAMNSNGDSDASNSLTDTTYANVNYATFTAVGTTSWTAPAGVTFVQYLIVGGGGGGGAAYSDILVIGNIPFQSSSPGVNIPYINSAAGSFYGYLFRNGSAYTLNRYARITAPQDITPQGTTYPYNKWYGTELVYNMNSTFPNTTNYFSPYTIDSVRCNNVSGGGGGGSGGQVLVQTGTTKYDVTPGTTYTVVVGAGGAGGTGGAGTETNGSAGGSSSFDAVTSAGGSGGGYSRLSAYVTNGFGKGGPGGQTSGNLVGGGGGGQASANNYGLYNSGGAGVSGTLVNFDGAGNVFYGAGGTGGVPNTVATGTTSVNVGKGGIGTGATLNGFASGIDGGSGIVILRYYT